MAHALTSEQIRQVVNNTVVVMLARLDLLPEWQENLLDLLQQARDANLDEEAIFVSAVLALLHSPGDTLPTGTAYDYAWQSIVTGLRTGAVEPAPAEEEALSLDRLLSSMSDALIAVLTQVPDQRETVTDELREIRTAASQANVSELTNWLDDALAALDGTPVQSLGQNHQGIYAVYWNEVAQKLQQVDG
jgi:hypothetical protein